MLLKEIRKRYGLSQTELAKITNTSQKTISNYENGNTEPDIKTIKLLADHFHVTIDNLVNHEVPYLIDKSTLTQEQQELFDKIKNLSDTNCKRVNDFINGLLIAEEEKEQIIQRYKRGDWIWKN